MARVKSPMLSTWASGTIGKSLTFRDDIKNQQFVACSAYLVHGRPSAEQKRIRKVFRNRGRYMALLMKENTSD